MTGALRKLRRFWVMSPDDRRLLLASAVMVPVVTATLRGVRIHTVFGGLRWLADRLPRPVAPDAPEVVVRRAGVLLGLAARNGLHEGTCLSRSATLWWLLRRRGIDVDLRIGVRKDDDRLDAHAWIEWNDVVIDDRPAAVRQYAAFAERVVP
jgi:hypothetical protein